MKTKLLLTVILGLIFLAVPARAELILTENFDCPDGTVFESELWHTNNYCGDLPFTILGGKLYINDATMRKSQSAFTDEQSPGFVGTFKEARVKIKALDNLLIRAKKEFL